MHKTILPIFLLFVSLSLSVSGMVFDDVLAPKNKYQSILDEIIREYERLYQNSPQSVGELKPNEKNLRFFYSLSNEGFIYKTIEDQPSRMLALVIRPNDVVGNFIEQFKKSVNQKNPALFQNLSFLKSTSNHIGIASFLLRKFNNEQEEKEISSELDRLINQYAVPFKINFRFLLLTHSGDVILVGVPDQECLLQLREKIKNNEKLNSLVIKDGFLIPFFIHSTICRILPDNQNKYKMNDRNLKELLEVINGLNPLSLEMDVNQFTLWNYDSGLDKPNIMSVYSIRKSC